MEPKKPFYDLTNKQFGNWKVLYYSGKGRWFCKCICGRTTQEILTSRLINKRTSMCRLCVDDMQRNPKINMSGMIVGQYKVIKPIGGGSYECQCSCGNKRIVKGFNLRQAIENNHNIMCDKCSYESRRDDLVDKTINNWTILKYLGNGIYSCRCKCGDIYEIQGKSIKNGSSKSCRRCGSEKMIQTRLKLYGDTCTNIKQKRTEEQLEAVQSKENLSYFIISHYNFKPKAIELSKMLGISECMTLRIIHKYELENLIEIDTGSAVEKEILEYIDKYSNKYDIIQHNRTVLSNGRELDIYIPDKKLAIEFNGDYWHSDIWKHKLYHQQKTLECAKQGIHLIHIFEHEWNNEDTKSKIKDLLDNVISNDKRKIYARNTVVKEINKEICSDFLNTNHLQGESNSSVHIGCYYGAELVGVITFGKPRFNQNYQYELHRLCWKRGINVVGGLEKIFKYFIKNYNPTSIISYVNISKFTGNSYLKVGFKVKEISNPNYLWINPTTKDILSRYKTQKHKLIELGLGTDEQTEEDIMREQGYLRIYDSGNLVMTFNNTINQ